MRGEGGKKKKGKEELALLSITRAAVELVSLVPPCPHLAQARLLQARSCPVCSLGL